MKRMLLAVILIASGFLGMFVEVTVARSKDYSIKATAFGSKIELHTYEEIKNSAGGGMPSNGIPGRNIEEVLDRILSGKVHPGVLCDAFREPVVDLRSLTDLVIPVLPEGCSFVEDIESVAWNDQGFCFHFTGEIGGYIYVTDPFSDWNWRAYYEGREYRKAGQWKVYENDRQDGVTVVGKKGPDRFYAMLWGQSDVISEEMLSQFDLEKYVSTNPKVLMFYDVHALRLLGIAVAASGGILLLCEIRRRRE